MIILIWIFWLIWFVQESSQLKLNCTVTFSISKKRVIVFFYMTLQIIYLYNIWSFFLGNIFLGVTRYFSYFCFSLLLNALSICHRVFLSWRFVYFIMVKKLIHCDCCTSFFLVFYLVFLFVLFTYSYQWNGT